MKFSRVAMTIIVAMIQLIVITNNSYSIDVAQNLDDVSDRFARGFIDCAVSPFDFLNYVEDERFKNGYFSAATSGIIRGIGWSVARAAFGVYQVSTCCLDKDDTGAFHPKYDAALIRID